MSETAEKEVRTLIDGWLEAVKARDLDKIMSNYTSEVLAFDAIAAVQFKGRDAYRKHWVACFEMCPGEGVMEIHDLGIETSGDLAFAHYLMRCGGPDASGEMKTGWMRVTVCLRKTGGSWLITHEHFSMPADMESGKVLFELEPEGLKAA
jgi:uncharacterized protein (TIGR02246 family)